MSKRVESQIRKIYNKIFKEVFTNERFEELANDSRSQVELAVAKIASSEKFNIFCDKFSKELAKAGLSHHRGDKPWQLRSNLR